MLTFYHNQLIQTGLRYFLMNSKLNVQMSHAGKEKKKVFISKKQNLKTYLNLHPEVAKLNKAVEKHNQVSVTGWDFEDDNNTRNK